MKPQVDGRNVQLRVSLYAMLGVVMLGSASSWDQNRYSLTTATVTYSVSLGAVVGSLLSVVFAELLGRKITLIAAAVLFFHNWALVILTATSLMLFAARFIAGIAIGLVSVVAPIYIGEISENSNRGVFGSLFFLMINIGFFLMYVCQNTWGVFQSWTESLFAYLSLASLIFTFLIPESPYHLARKNKPAAKKILQYLRSGDVTEHFNDLVNEVGKSPPGLPKLKHLLNSPEAKRALVLTSCLLIVQASCGIITIKYVSTNGHVFNGDVKLYKIVFAVYLLVQVLMSMLYYKFVSDRRRKYLMQVALWIMALCLLMIGLYFRFWWFYYTGPWSAGLFIVMFLAAFNLGFGPVPWILTSELYSEKTNSVKTLVYGLSVALFWLARLVWNELLRKYLYSVGIDVFCWISCAICVIVVVFVIPYTDHWKQQIILKQPLHSNNI